MVIELKPKLQSNFKKKKKRKEIGDFGNKQVIKPYQINYDISMKLGILDDCLYTFFSYKRSLFQFNFLNVLVFISLLGVGYTGIITVVFLT